MQFFDPISFYSFLIQPFLYQLMNFLLYLGTLALERDKRGFNKMKLIRIYSIILIISQPLMAYFSFLLPIYLPVFIFSLVVSIFGYIAFFLAGISNRTQYGNYLVSATLLFVTSGITNFINFVIGGIDVVFGLQYSSFFTSAMFLTGVLGVTYILFFALRIKSKLIILYCSLGLLFNFYIFVLTPFFILLIVYVPVVFGILI
jgi:hypothetical protein